MILDGDGHRIELVPIAYEFPDYAPDGERDWDANWLMVRGHVLTRHGRGWTFADPCLTTWNAHRLADWFDAIPRHLRWSP